MKPSTATRAISLLALSFCVAAASYPQAHKPCNEEDAKKEFISALDEMSDDNWQAAIGHLEKAADLCPVPPGLIEVRSFLFVKSPYIPYYYLGTCHKNLEELPDALRQFYLSSCVGEPARGGSQIKDLGSLTETCLNSIRSPQRPKKHIAFIEGHFAAQQQRWGKSAEKMWDSMHVWPEDGRTTYASGRWPEAYLPRFQLAKALNKLGCKQQACDQLKQSILGELVANNDQRVTIESKEMLDLQAACADRSQPQQRDEMTCQRWACWLREKG
jgi:hypothetical protein